MAPILTRDAIKAYSIPVEALSSFSSFLSVCTLSPLPHPDIGLTDIK